MLRPPFWRYNNSGATKSNFRRANQYRFQSREHQRDVVSELPRPFGPDCDLKRHGEGIMRRGGKNAKKRAVIAVARKLAVLLHQLWISGHSYEPNHLQHRQTA